MYAYIYEHIMELHISNSLRKCELAMGIYIRFILFFSSEGGGWMRCPTNDMRIVRSFPRESAISGLKKWCILTCVV